MNSPKPNGWEVWEDSDAEDVDADAEDADADAAAHAADAATAATPATTAAAAEQISHLFHDVINQIYIYTILQIDKIIRKP